MASTLTTSLRMTLLQRGNPVQRCVPARKLPISLERVPVNRPLESEDTRRQQPSSVESVAMSTTARWRPERTWKCGGG
jgi:hypothetical protein